VHGTSWLTPRGIVRELAACGLIVLGDKGYLGEDCIRTRTAVSVPGGPGPSIIDLPAPGCWTLHLSWSGHTDKLKLHYVA
jgi:hypothetical protein